MSKERRKAKVFTNKSYDALVNDVEVFVDNRLVYYIECLPEKVGTYGFVVYY